MTQTPANRGHEGIARPHPVPELREHLAQTLSAADRLRSIFGAVVDPDRRVR